MNFLCFFGKTDLDKKIVLSSFKFIFLYYSFVILEIIKGDFLNTLKLKLLIPDIEAPSFARCDSYIKYMSAAKKEPS